MLALSLAAVLLQPPTSIDLDADAARQTVIDREAGQYLGHVSSVLLGDKRTILIAYPKGHGRGPIVLKSTEDGGRTWSERLPTPGNWTKSQETPTLHRLRDPKTGRHRLILWSGLYPARIAHSEDEGKTWSPLADAGRWGGIVVMGGVEPVGRGRYVAMFHDDGRFFVPGGKVAPNFTLYQTFSDDGGRTWSFPEALWSGSEVHLCEPGFVRSPDGKTLAVLLRENRRRRNSHVMFSSDGAKTWSLPREGTAELTGDRHIARYDRDGRLVVVFRDMAEGPTKGDWVAWVGTWDDLVHNRPGQYRVRLKDNKNSWDCGYSGLERLPDGTFVATTYGHWTEGEQPYLLCVRFKLSELDALARRG